MIVWGTTILDQLISGLLWFLFISIFSIKGTEVIYDFKMLQTIF